MNLDITLPALSEINDRQNLEKIKGYLASLNDRLNYMLLNIDTENLADGLALTISSSAENADYAKEKALTLDETVIKLEGRLSKVSQTADKISWLIADTEDASSFSLTPYMAELIADSINISGCVTFESLSEEGKTSVNGGNIISGSISADKINVSDLSALSAKLGGWELTDTAIIGRGQYNSALYINSAASADPYWLKAVNANGYTTFYIAKNGSCYLDGGFISRGSITADKIVCDSENRLDLLNNYNGIKVGHEMLITDGSINCRLFINAQGNLTFDTGKGDIPFSFALMRNGEKYTLSVLNGAGQSVGEIPLNGGE